MRLKQAVVTPANLNVLELLALAIALYIAGNYPGNGRYEPELYALYAPQFWFFLLLAGVCGLGALYLASLENDREGFWSWGVVCAALPVLVVFLLPALRGYAFVTPWDDVEAVGRITDLLARGRLDSRNFYPFVHLLTASMTMFSGLELRSLVIGMPALLYLIYLANMVFASYVLIPIVRVRMFLIGLAIPVPLLMGNVSSNLKPTLLALVCFPTAIAWLLKSRQETSGVVDRIVPAAFLITTGLIHPVFSALLIIFMIYLLFTDRLHFAPGGYQFRDLEQLILMALILVVAWFGSFEVSAWAFEQAINVARSLFITQSLPTSTSLASRAVKVDYQQTSLFYLPILGVTLMVTLVALRYASTWKKNDLKPSSVSGALIGLYFTSITLAVFSFLVRLFYLGHWRFLVAVLPLAPLILSLWLVDAMRNKPTGKIPVKPLVHFGLFALAVLALVAGTFSVFRAPFIGRPNPALSRSHLSGIRFAFDHLQPSFGRLIYSPTPERRTFNSIMGFTDQTKLQRDQPFWMIRPAPAHFGYDLENSSMDFIRPGYLWISSYARARFGQAEPPSQYFTSQDFFQLQFDPAWSMVYTSGDLEIWYRTRLQVESLDGKP